MVSAAPPPDRAELVATASRTIRDGSRSFHAASQLFDRTTRERAWLLYSWCRHCDDVCDGQDLGHRAEQRPQALEDIEALTRDTLAGAPPDIFFYQALAAVLDECAIPHRFLTDHLAGFALDTEGWRPQDERDLVTYCYHVAGAVGCMMAVVMGVDPRDEDTLESASALGISFQLSNIARDLKEDRAAGRCYVPASWLREYSVDPAAGLPADDPDMLAVIAARLVRLADQHELKARKGVPMLPFRSRWAVLAAARIYGEIGRRVAALGPAAWDKRVVIRRRVKLRFLLSSFVETLRTGGGEGRSYPVRAEPVRSAGSRHQGVAGER
ncbi:phytoene/squalene synthase family protein [Sphingosinicella sp. YJ22]|uniref:phytoene/squalene synthase family protein n=1 Tax=Sphingosinicella sp. YJ22 TaxID=1104780 RepID=UPI001408BF79|nr:phytoene/squalene synthase family protein [Sphingosinicella sp. YJ22]